MKSVLVIAIVCVFVASAFAAADCGAGKTCKGPVQAMFSDEDCKTLVTGSVYDQIFPDDFATGGTCYTDGTAKNSFKWKCGSRIVTHSYTESNCKGPAAVSYSFPTGKCAQFADTPENRYGKIQCASASTATFSAALVALLAFVALLF
jgi:hypothetical protein